MGEPSEEQQDLDKKYKAGLTSKYMMIGAVTIYMRTLYPYSNG